MKRAKILICDDHPHFLEVVENLLRPRFKVVGKVTDGRALCETAAALKTDVIVTDISMPVLNGIDAAVELRKSECNSKIVFLTVHTAPEFVDACLAAGASAYVKKPRMTDDLIPGIQNALDRRCFVSPCDIAERRHSSFRAGDHCRRRN